MRSMNERVERARRFAAVAHRRQRYGDEFPYFVHLWTAYSVAVRFGINDPDVLSAVLLHDVLEDTSHQYEDLESYFGPRVAGIVALVTEPKNMTRKERHAVTYPLIRPSEDARIVKLCDRISHCEFGGKKVNMYQKEHSEFKRYLGEPLTEVEAVMWNYLDDLLIEIEPAVPV